MITQQQLDDHVLWLKTRFTNQVQGCRLVAIDADLTDANLTRANLTRANLTDANLTAANLTSIEADIAKILAENPTEVAGLLETLQQGRIDGTVYEGECACLVGTIAKLKAIDYRQLPYDSARPAEAWFFSIKKGNTPANSQIAAITEQWIIKWMAANTINIANTAEAIN